MKACPTIQSEVELALDFVDGAAEAACRLPAAEGAVMRALLAVARSALLACGTEAGDLTRVRRAAGGQPVTAGLGRVRRRVWRLARRLGLARPDQAAKLDLLFGRRAIARYLGVTRAQCRTLLRDGALPTFRLAGVECARRSSLRRHVRALEEARQ